MPGSLADSDVQREASVSGMTEGDRPTLDPDLLKRLEAIRARFEDAWDSASWGDQPPSIDAFLRDTVEPERSIILQELSAIERRRRERPTVGAEGPGPTASSASSATEPGEPVADGSMETFA